MSAHFLLREPIFHGKKMPEEGRIVGYAAIIEKLRLPMPMVQTIAMVCDQNKGDQKEGWLILPIRYLPIDEDISEIEALYNHLTVALKYEGVDLLVFKLLTSHYSESQLTQLVDIKPTGQYSRRIWFIIEWLLGHELSGKKDLKKKSYVNVLDNKLQYGVEGTKSHRQLVINNLPGTVEFCPLIRKTEKLEQLINKELAAHHEKYVSGIRKELIQRASAFLLLKDSKASFTIEGESPKSRRAARWGRAIGQAGSNVLSTEELIRLQQIVIENPRFVTMGLRVKGGFIGEHDSLTGEPIPDHISARWQDLPLLLQGLTDTNELFAKSDIDAVLAAAIIAFGFVFIHPFQDGNGRIHRYLIHHVLAQKRFSKQGIIFPVSASILDRIDEYRTALESYSQPLLEFQEWEETKDHNVKVNNKTINYYRYFDATVQAEFLYECVHETIINTIPSEINYLKQFYAFKEIIDEKYEMPDKKVSLLLKFLEQNNGQLSNRARQKEFTPLLDHEVNNIEKIYTEIFVDDFGTR